MATCHDVLEFNVWWWKCIFRLLFQGILSNTNSAHKRRFQCRFKAQNWVSERERESDEWISPIVSIVYYILSHKNIFPTYKHRKLVHLQIVNRPNSYKKGNTARDRYTRRSVLTRTACAVCKNLSKCRSPIFAFHQLWIQWRHIYKINTFFGYQSDLGTDWMIVIWAKPDQPMGNTEKQQRLLLFIFLPVCVRRF